MRIEPRETDWLVCDMDQGVLRRERTRKAALAWVMHHVNANKREAADGDEHAAPEVKARLGEHLARETARRAAR